MEDTSRLGSEPKPGFESNPEAINDQVSSGFVPENNAGPELENSDSDDINIET